MVLADTRPVIGGSPTSRLRRVVIAGLLALTVSCSGSDTADDAAGEPGRSASTQVFTTQAPTTTSTSPPAPPPDASAAPSASAETPTAPPGGFLATFDGTPASPTPFDDWDVVVHTRDGEPGEIFPMQADHGDDCGPPPAQHAVTHAASSVFICRDHMMTAIDGGEYGEVILTAPVMVDFSTGTAVVEWDVSTVLSSARDWWDVWITPPDDVVPLPGDPDLPDSDVVPPRNGIQIRLITWDPFADPKRTGVGVFIRRDAGRMDWGEHVNTEDVAGIEMALAPEEPSATRRDTFRLELSKDRIRFGMPDYDHWFVDDVTISPALDWTQGVVQIGHHSYNPFKDDAVANAHPGTWHWDNVLIAPAVS